MNVNFLCLCQIASSISREDVEDLGLILSSASSRHSEKEKSEDLSSLATRDSDFLDEEEIDS